MPPRVVFDTNVYISIFAFSEKPVGFLLDLAVIGAIDLFVCPFILKEFRRVAELKFGFEDEQVNFFEDRILGAGELVNPSEKVAIIKSHEEDNQNEIGQEEPEPCLNKATDLCLAKPADIQHLL